MAIISTIEFSAKGIDLNGVTLNVILKCICYASLLSYAARCFAVKAMCRLRLKRCLTILTG